MAITAGISVVIPCFNSAATLPALVDRLAETLPSCAEKFEVILVNDDDGDDTWNAIRTLSTRYPWVVGLNLMRNYGQHNATLCGVRHARYATTVTMDDDLQHPPEELPKLLAALEQGQDLVYGTPLKTPQTPYRFLLSWIIRFAIAVATRQRTVRDLSAYRAFRTSLRGAFVDYRSPQVILDVLLGWGTTRVTTVAVRHDPREIGTSNYGFFHLINTALAMWTGYTTAPLRFASWLGFSFVVFGFLVLAYVIGMYLWLGSLPGFPFLASTIAIFGGVQLFTLGIIGEYLARVFNRSLDQPVYVVEQRIGEEAPDRP